MDDVTRALAFQQSNGYCMCSKECVKRASQLHHMLPNSEVNRKNFPMLIDSIFNLLPVNHDCHMSGRVPKLRPGAAKRYEEWLQIFSDKAYIQGVTNE